MLRERKKGNQKQGKITMKEPRNPTNSNIYVYMQKDLKQSLLYILCCCPFFCWIGTRALLTQLSIQFFSCVVLSYSISFLVFFFFFTDFLRHKEAHSRLGRVCCLVAFHSPSFLFYIQLGPYLVDAQAERLNDWSTRLYCFIVGRERAFRLASAAANNQPMSYSYG